MMGLCGRRAATASATLLIIGLIAASPATAAPGSIITPYAGINGTSATEIPGPATSSPLALPFGLAVDATGDLYISNLEGEQIDEVDPSETLSVLTGTGASGPPSYGGPATSSDLAYPAGLTVNSDGTVYVAEALWGAVDRIGQPTPGVPRDVALTAQDGSAALSFTAPVDPGTSPVTGYQTSLDDGASWQPITTSTTDGTLTGSVGGLTDGVSYIVRVRAVNSSGPGTSSLPASVTPIAPPTPAARHGYSRPSTEASARSASSTQCSPRPEPHDSSWSDISNRPPQQARPACDQGVSRSNRFVSIDVQRGMEDTIAGGDRRVVPSPTPAAHASQDHFLF